jgi:dimethylaniline monooxygenase (N-oxide forming)
MRIAIIGSGISGIAAGRILARSGHEVVVFERSGSIGGVWALAYPQVRLQNIAEHYQFADFPWPFPPDLHPTGEQIRRYLQAAVERFQLDVRLRHEVIELREEPDGWTARLRAPDGERAERFDHVVVAVGHYSQEKPEMPLPGRDRFRGQVLTERDIKDLDVLANRRVAVVGFGKSAVDMASFAVERGSKVHHVFREPRWLIPRRLFGVHAANVLFGRMSTVMLPSWVHPNRVEAALHERLSPVVSGFWRMVTLLVRAQTGLHALWRDPAVRERMRLLEPEQSVPYQMRAASALAPDNYYPSVIRGNIMPCRGEVAGLSEDALLLADGRSLPCDMVVLAVGHKAPAFPFLPERHRILMESEPDGAQLYRHVLHPRIPRLSFAGYNHGFLHVPGVEIAMIWLAAHLRGDLELPSPEEMERSAAAVRDWKRQHSLFEAARSYGIATRFHQYFDVMLADLGVSPYRKQNPLWELVGPYTAKDYRTVFEDHERARASGTAPRRPLPLDT